MDDAVHVNNMGMTGKSCRDLMATFTSYHTGRLWTAWICSRCRWWLVEIWVVQNSSTRRWSTSGSWSSTRCGLLSDTEPERCYPAPRRAISADLRRFSGCSAHACMYISVRR